jgi:N-acetylglucosaminyldiphosphoundecaprenol N-acetyl-beta-D-mannosaminyltransferase
MSTGLMLPSTPPATRCRPTFDLLGLPVDRIDRAGALQALEEFIDGGRPRLVLTADASGVVIAAGDTEFAAIWRAADLVTPDSAGILWAARRAGCSLRERVSGVELAERLCELGAMRGFGVFFYGAAPGVAERAAREMERRYPGLRVVGTAHGFVSPHEQAELVARIRALQPAVLLVALGIPRQEKWIAANLAELGVPVCMGVGGTLDVFAGVATRAPAWMQRRGLEWLYRLARNPKKIAKVATLPRFVWMVLTRRRVRAAAPD